MTTPSSSPSAQDTQKKIIVSTLEYVPGFDIVMHLGMVQGSTVRTKNVFRDMAAGIKNMFGGELKGYTELLEESRKEAMVRLLTQARRGNADAVLNIRFTTSAITKGAAEIFAYGTAVRLTKKA